MSSSTVTYETKTLRYALPLNYNCVITREGMFLKVDVNRRFSSVFFCVAKSAK